MGFVGCWVTFWWLDTCGPVGIDRWFSDVGLAEMWEGILKVVWWLLAGFPVVEKYGECLFFSFLSNSGLTCDDASNRSMFALNTKTDAGQPKQN